MDVIRSEQFDDVYFSAEDGAAETEHVFLQGNNLPEAWGGKERFVIGETGFGTGLNFLLAWQLFDRTAKEGAFLDFISVEKFPLKPEQIRKALSPWAGRLSPYLDKMLAQYPVAIPGFHRMVFDGCVALTLVFGDANDVLPEVEGSVDAWFLDGFTPAKNPDMWTDRVFQEMARLSHEGTSFATFTAAGFVKRGLEAAGFAVEKRKGFGRKKDMLGGMFKGALPPLSPRKRGERRSLRGEVAIHGAGLAGTAAAYVLRQYGFRPALYDPNGIASGASGNEVGLINPRFTAFRNAQSDFYAGGFAQILRVFPDLENIHYRVCGALHLVTDGEKEKRFRQTIANWGWPEEEMRFLDAREASEVAGVELSLSALYLPRAGQVSPKALCHAYAKDIPLITRLKDLPEGINLYASGAAMPEKFSGLPIHTVRGQVTFVKINAETEKLKTNICYSGYISAAREGVHAVGSTFQKWLSHSDLLDEDNDDNLRKLYEKIPAYRNLEIVGAWAALRVASRDHFPVIGAIEDAYVSAAHGSHGILSSLMAAHVLADYLRGGPFCLGRATLKSLEPQRFFKE
jgi:tRNA 5-methylaminomethyl-2-thiouridine biosynthesis bifunctional protein